MGFFLCCQREDVDLGHLVAGELALDLTAPHDEDAASHGLRVSIATFVSARTKLVSIVN